MTDNSEKKLGRVLFNKNTKQHLENDIKKDTPYEKTPPEDIKNTNITIDNNIADKEEIIPFKLNSSKPQKKMRFLKGDLASKDIHKPITALHISSKFVVLVQTIYDGLSYSLDNFVFAECLVDAQSNMGSDQEKEAALLNAQCDAIDSVFSKAGLDKSSTPVVSSMSGANIVVNPVKINLKYDIKSQLPKLMMTPFDNTNASFEYIYVDGEDYSPTDLDKEATVIASAIDNELFFKTQGILSAAEVHCNILDVDIMAVLNLYLESVAPNPDELNCILDIGTDVSYIIMHPGDDSKILIRNLEFTYNSFKKMLQHNRNLTTSEVEDLLETTNFYDYLSKSFESGTTNQLNERYPVNEFIKQTFIEELSKTFDYYTKKIVRRMPNRIFLAGKAVKFVKFTNFIKSTMEFPCEELDILSFLLGNEKLKNDLFEHRDIAYKAVGLALRYI